MACRNKDTIMSGVLELVTEVEDPPLEGRRSAYNCAIWQ